MYGENIPDKMCCRFFTTLWKLSLIWFIIWKYHAFVKGGYKQLQKQNKHSKTNWEQKESFKQNWKLVLLFGKKKLLHVTDAKRHSSQHCEDTLLSNITGNWHSANADVLKVRNCQSVF